MEFVRGDFDSRSELELRLRANLANEMHSKESIINCAVNFAMELHDCEAELLAERLKHSKEKSGFEFLRQVLNLNRILELTELAEIIEHEFQNPILAAVIRKASEKIKKNTASKGGSKKLENDFDGKQKLKKLIHASWKNLTEGQKKYGYKAEFARSMLKIHTGLTSQKVVESWCKEWEMESC